MKKKLKIIYEDKSLIIVDKPAGVLTISTDNKLDDNLYYDVMTYLKQKNKNNRVFIVHRLDKDTSGLVLFAKDIKVKEYMQKNWQNVIRKYYAIVNGKPPKMQDEIVSYLKEDKFFKVHSTNNIKDEKAITRYQTIKKTNKYSLLDIQILTGKKNQIRVHMFDIGCPIVGDKKYFQIKNNPIGRLALHAYYLEFSHPLTSEKIILSSDYPLSFKKIIDIN